MFNAAYGFNVCVHISTMPPKIWYLLVTLWCAISFLWRITHIEYNQHRQQHMLINGQIDQAYESVNHTYHQMTDIPKNHTYVNETKWKAKCDWYALRVSKIIMGNAHYYQRHTRLSTVKMGRSLANDPLLTLTAVINGNADLIQEILPRIDVSALNDAIDGSCIFKLVAQHYAGEVRDTDMVDDLCVNLLDRGFGLPVDKREEMLRYCYLAQLFRTFEHIITMNDTVINSGYESFIETVQNMRQPPRPAYVRRFERQLRANVLQDDDFRRNEHKRMRKLLKCCGWSHIKCAKR